LDLHFWAALHYNEFWFKGPISAFYTSIFCPQTESNSVMAATTISAVLTDEELMRAFVDANDRASFEMLVNRYQNEIFNYLRRYLADDALAEDAFQTTFVRVFQKAEQFDAGRKFRPWLYGIATHQAIDLKRRNKRRTVQSLDVQTTHSDSRESTHAANIADYRQSIVDPVEQAELRGRMAAAIEEVGEPGRSALELVYLQGLPYRDAAEILDVPVGTVKSRVHAAIRKLATIWQRSNP
jgi:RNA polymerase sigma-70 factor, ECF subfamily